MTYLYIGLVVGCGAMIQGAIGFAFGIFSIPLLVFIGIPLEQAITLVLILVLIQTLSSFWHNFRHESQDNFQDNPTKIPWRDVLAISIPRFITVVIGVYLLREIKEQWTPTSIKQMIGASLLAVVGIQLWLRPKPRAHLGIGWTWLAGTISGIMAGLIGMGGSPVVLWVVAHDWPSQKSRALMWTTFSLLVPWQMVVAYHRFGMPVLKSAALGLAYIPVVVLTSTLGTRLGNRISQIHLRRIAYGVLIFVGLLSILSPYLSS